MGASGFGAVDVFSLDIGGGQSAVCVSIVRRCRRILCEIFLGFERVTVIEIYLA